MRNMFLCFLFVCFLYSCDTQTPQQKADKMLKELNRERQEKVKRDAFIADSLLRIITDIDEGWYIRIKAKDELKQRFEFFRKITDDSLYNIGEKR